MYFDAILDENWHPVFNGTPEETKKFAKTLDTDKKSRYVAIPGKTMQNLSIAEYLK